MYFIKLCTFEIYGFEGKKDIGFIKINQQCIITSLAYHYFKPSKAPKTPSITFAIRLRSSVSSVSVGSW